MVEAVEPGQDEARYKEYAIEEFLVRSELITGPLEMKLTSLRQPITSIYRSC